jgi:hypothetical protein
MLAVCGTDETSPWMVRRLVLINPRKFGKLLKGNLARFVN